MNELLWLALVLLAIAMVFYAMENFFLAVLLFGAALFVVVGTLLYRTLKYGGKKAKGTAKISEEVEEAEAQHPSAELIGAGLKEMGKKAGDHLWLEKKVWTTGSKGSGTRERIGKSSKNFIDRFFELFK